MGKRTRDEDTFALVEEGREVVEALGRIPAPYFGGLNDDGPWVTPEGLEAVLAIMRGRGVDLFRLLDEKPGTSHWGGYKGLAGEWHYKLRRVRNSSGGLLMKALREEA